MSLTIVMYHYIRDLAGSRYPGIKGLTIPAFRAQLDYFERNYTFVGMDQVVETRRSGERLPSNALLLTFDDGYSDHFQTVFPLLHERGLQGAFFPVAKPVMENTVLDVNKVHFVLSAVVDKQSLVTAVLNFVGARRLEFNLDTPSDYWQKYGKPSRFDEGEVVFIKRMLQKHLPEDARAELTDQLFRKYVSTDEKAFAQELYASADELRTMARCGMYIGSHSYSHYWMDSLSPEKQGEEIRKSLEFLRFIDQPTKDWVMCYPYGAHNDSLTANLVYEGCVLGLTTRSAAVNVDADDPLRWPRFDTTELPQLAAAAN